MKQNRNWLAGIAGGTVMALASAVAVPPMAAAAETGANATHEAGREIAFDRKRGNCLACHLIMGGTSPGTIGPPLIAMQLRYPDKDQLRKQIWDATIANPQSPMPPFGSHEILNDQQIDQLVEFIWSL